MIILTLNLLKFIISWVPSINIAASVANLQTQKTFSLILSYNYNKQAHTHKSSMLLPQTHRLTTKEHGNYITDSKSVLQKSDFYTAYIMDSKPDMPTYAMYFNFYLLDGFKICPFK